MNLKGQRLALLGFFALYVTVDKWMNPAAEHEVPAEETVGSLPFGLILALTALIAIAIAGP